MLACKIKSQPIFLIGKNWKGTTSSVFPISHNFLAPGSQADMAQNFEKCWKVKILDILILILILKTGVSKYWFWYWYWNLHFQNIDFDIDIELFGNFDIDIGIDIEKNEENINIWVVRKTQVPLWPWGFG